MDGRGYGQEDGAHAQNGFFHTAMAAANMQGYQQPPPGWSPFMYGLQAPPPGWFHPGMQQAHPSAAMFPPATSAAMGSGVLHMGQHTGGVDDEVQVLPSPAGDPSPSSERATRTKLSNFNPSEDQCLVKAWLEISCDPIIGNGQRGDGFWKRVLERYNFRRGENPKRSHRSLSSRWALIRAQCSKFAGRYADTQRLNPSGTSDADMTSIAATNFADLEGHAFGYFHCWDLMKDEPNWRDPPDQHEDGIGDGTQDTEGDGQEGEKSKGKRPIGRDKAKSNSKRSKSGDTSSAEYANRLQDLSIQKISIMQEEVTRKGERFQHLASIDEQRYMHLQSHNQSLLQIEQEKVKIMRDKHELEEKKEEERILSINLDECAVPLRAYYASWQEEILDKINARRASRNRP